MRSGTGYIGENTGYGRMPFAPACLTVNIDFDAKPIDWWGVQRRKDEH